MELMRLDSLCLLLAAKKFLGKFGGYVSVFRVGDLIRMKDGCWWLQENGPRFRNYTEKDRLVLVTKIQDEQGSGFFYGSICSTGEERLWTANEFELVSNIY